MPAMKVTQAMKVLKMLKATQGHYARGEEERRQGEGGEVEEEVRARAACQRQGNRQIVSRPRFGKGGCAIVGQGKDARCLKAVKAAEKKAKKEIEAQAALWAEFAAAEE